MTQQIINIGTGPDSYTGDNLRTAFQKINENFSQLYAGNVGGNVSANTLTANNLIANSNITAGNITSLNSLVSQGNVSGAYFIGDGSLLTGVASNLGNLAITGTSQQTITGTANATIALEPEAGRNVAFLLRSSSNVQVNLSIASLSANTLTMSSGGNIVLTSPNINLHSTGNLTLSANSNPGINTTGMIRINSNNGHMGFNTTPDGYTFTMFGDVFANAFYAAENITTGYSFATPNGLTGINHVYQNDVNGNVSLVRISHDNSVPAKFYENNHTILSGNLVVSQFGNVFGTGFPDAFLQVFSNVGSYSQFVMQNFSSNALASTDFVVTADNGNDSAYYGDFGIASSTANAPGYGLIKPDDVYLIAVGENDTGPGSAGSANLVIGSTTGNINFFVGAPEDANVVAKLSTSGLSLQSGNLVIVSGNAPFAASDPGQAGQLAWDTNYIYVCVAANTWKRANLSSW